MGNCQAVDAAALVIQHPNGKIDRMYWAVSASEVMKMNPGHYVTLIITFPVSGDKTVRFTRVKLLRPSDTLVLGRAYRLVTTQEVMKVLRAKKHGRLKKKQQELPGNTENPRSSCELQAGNSEPDNNNQGIKHDRQRQRPGITNSAAAAARSKSWRPTLHSISEFSS
ncbi:hypothetical protein RND71_008591 [Anisodus tanguticus]|uniref:DUF4228 domain-containing protein n=1 Tax=Anisodus tanguticus TaxID=243964 RepID=A0AAE1VL68_9SOLA|nr:hypothetical protein RND71_008591 [Anisodus tanguticus]